MTNSERITQHNEELRECIELVGEGGGGGSGGSGIIDVTELPTENIDAVYRMNGEESAEILVAIQSGAVMSLGDFFASLVGATSVTYYLVDALPDTMTASDMETFSAFYVYILRSTGVGYLSTDGTSATSMGTLFAGGADKDKGWTTDPTSIVTPAERYEFYAILVPPSTTYGIPTVENTFIYGYNGSSWDEFAVKEPLLASANFTDYAELAGSVDGIVMTGHSAPALTCLKIQGNVTALGENALNEQGALTSVIIPTSVTSIGASAFSWCVSLTSIVYNGTKEQWKAITKGDNWDDGTPDYIITCTDGTIAKDGTET